MPLVFDPATLKAPRLKEAFAHWESLRRGRAMPSRRDLDPVDIPRLLPYLMLVDVEPEPLDFRYRLIGTEARSILARDYTGLRFSALPGKGRGSIVWDNCEQVVVTRSPVSRSAPYVGPETYLRDCENLLLPLSEDGCEVNMIVKFISFSRRAD